MERCGCRAYRFNWWFPLLVQNAIGSEEEMLAEITMRLLELIYASEIASCKYSSGWFMFTSRVTPQQVT